MAKYALIASTPKMEAEAQKIVWETARRDVAIYMLPARETASAGRLAVESGAEIIIARGGIAAEVKRSTNLTVVEVVITAQEMGLLIKKNLRWKFPIRIMLLRGLLVNQKKRQNKKQQKLQ